MSALAALEDPLHATVLAGDQWLRHPAAGIHRHDASIGTERGWLSPGFERMHIRLYDPGAPEPNVAPYTAGAIHHDQVVYTRRCVYPPEVATSFNIPRDWLARRSGSRRVGRRANRQGRIKACPPVRRPQRRV